MRFFLATPRSRGPLSSTWRWPGLKYGHYLVYQSGLNSGPNLNVARISRRAISNNRPIIWSFLTKLPSITPQRLRGIPDIPGPVSFSKNIDSTSRTPLFVLLLTPGHVGILDSSHKEIPHLLDRSFESPDKDQRIDVLISIVDRIPQVTLPSDQSHGDSQLLDKSINDGSEGIAVAILDSKNSAPDLWSRREVSVERDSMTIQQRCSISFAIRDSGQPQHFCKFQLPVANTLFLNGKTSTLVAQRWIRSPSQGQTPSRFHMLEEKSLPEQVLNLTFDISEDSDRPRYRSNLFLTRITESRVVSASVGNIIQKISLPDRGISEDVPASQELETVINQLAQEEAMVGQKLDVWALIAPPRMPVPSTVGVTNLLEGCRLHKILSGGGGWGVKQGLLSIDPDSDYRSLVKGSEATSFPGLQDDEEQGMRMFEDVVKQGESVTFYINKTKNVDHMKMLKGQRERSLPFQLFQFGTIPSTTDAPLANLSTEKSSNSSSDAILINDHFGMLSEQGMSLEYGSSASKHNDGCHEAEVGKTLGEGDGKTKVDPPFTVIAIEVPHTSQ